MADVRCPMCGKLNPADATVCRYCQARLKPLAVSPAESGTERTPVQSDAERTPVQSDTGGTQPPEASQPPEESSDDWLHGLLAPSGAAEEPGEAPAEPKADANEGEVLADWLSRIRQRTREEQDALSKIGTPSEINETPASTPEPPDLLSNLSDEPGVSSANAGDVTSWLDSLRDSDIPIEPPPSENTPVAGADSAPAAEQSDDDWLSNLTASNYSDLFGEAEPETPATAPMPSDAQPEAEEASAMDIPDWLRDMETPPAEAEPPAPTEPAAESADMPDWLKDLQPPAGPAAESETAATPAEEIPDWLGDARGAPLEETPVPANPVEPGETPEWLSSFNMPPAEETPLEPAAANYPEEIPDWLREFQPSASAQEPVEDQNQGSSAEPGQSETPSTEPTHGAESPDWMKEYPSFQPARTTGDDWPNTFSSSASLPEEPPDKPSHEPEAIIPAPANVKTPAEPAPPFASAEFNEILAGLALDEAAVNKDTGSSESESLEPAELPNWLQAMRPVESAMANAPGPSAVDDDRLEQSGPLAGLRGVLPGEELVSKYRKPPVYTNKLRVSDKQHLHTNLLENILADEAKSQPVPAEPTQAHQTIIRVLVAVVLILVVIVPQFVGFTLPVPVNLAASQPAMAAAYNSVNTLPMGGTVLIAADFEAGLTGEMRAAAGPLLRHLQTRQAKIVLASTIPAGPVLGELLLKEAGSTPVANLGYIPGGSNALKILGMRATADLSAPLQKAAPYPYNKDWSDPVLKTLRDVSSFQRIIVLTDSVESARAWIEQVQPSLGANTQLVMVSSAQAAPLVRAYLESGQILGLVSGLAGGAGYEQLTRQPGMGASSWTAYQLSLVAVIILIVVGGLIAGISALFQRSQTKRKA